MLIALVIPALVFVVGLTVMMRNEDRSMKRNQSPAMFCRKEP